MQTTTIYRPVGAKELALIAATDFRRFPPRLPDQPIFYPVMNEEYARQIAERWNARDGKSGYVTRFQVDSAFLARYAIQTVGSHIHQELWVPAEELAAFNDHIVGQIEVIAEFHSS